MPEPRSCGPLPRSQAEQTLTHSCPGGKEAARRARAGAGLPPPLLLRVESPGGWQAARGGTGKHGPGASPHLVSADPGPGEGGEPVGSPSRSSFLTKAPPGRPWRSRPGSYRRRGDWAAAPWSTWGPGGDQGRRGPYTGRGKPRRPAGRVGARRSGEPGRPGVSQKSPCLITHSRAAECDRSLLNLPIRDEISPSNLDGLHSIKQK